MINIILSLICCCFLAECNHFYGGTVTWEPLKKVGFAANISVRFTQSYQWHQSHTPCDRSFIVDSSRKIPISSDRLQCVSTSSSSCDGYSSANINEYCTDFSSLLNASFTQIVNTERITVGSKICVVYQGVAWPPLLAPRCAFTCRIDDVRGSIGSCVDLTVRPDGIINSPPVAAIVSRTFSATRTISVDEKKKVE